MDWLWPMYQEFLERRMSAEERADQRVMRERFMEALGKSTATLFVMEPSGDTIIFKGLGRWPIPEVPQLLADPNGFIADGFGGGKFKVNFHYELSFVGTHNFRTQGDEIWREMEEVVQV